MASQQMEPAWLWRVARALGERVFHFSTKIELQLSREMALAVQHILLGCIEVSWCSSACVGPDETSVLRGIMQLRFIVDCVNRQENNSFCEEEKPKAGLLPFVGNYFAPFETGEAVLASGHGAAINESLIYSDLLAAFTSVLQWNIGPSERPVISSIDLRTSHKHIARALHYQLALQPRKSSPTANSCTFSQHDCQHDCKEFQSAPYGTRVFVVALISTPALGEGGGHLRIPPPDEQTPAMGYRTIRRAALMCLDWSQGRATTTDTADKVCASGSRLSASAGKPQASQESSVDDWELSNGLPQSPGVLPGESSPADDTDDEGSSFLVCGGGTGLRYRGKPRAARST